MPRKLRPGEVVNGYCIGDHLNTGQKAIAYRAEKDGKTYFLKQYKSPTVTVEWYRKYVAFERRKHDRLRNAGVAECCVLPEEAFESKDPKGYFQVYAFLDNGQDLEHRLARMAKEPRPLTWERRVLMAKVIMAAVRDIHKAGVVHADLKPANIYMIEAPEATIGYRPLLIDMDFSLLADEPPPWRGFEGDVGTPRYFSPEHVSGAGAVPASDIFTCGIILHELLVGRHPVEEAADYEAIARAGIRQSFRLPSKVQKLDDSQNRHLESVLGSMMHADPARRPSADAVWQALCGRGSASTRPPVVPVPPSVKPPREGIRPSGSKHVRLELTGASGSLMKVNVRTPLGKASLRQFDPDAGRFAREVQYVLEPDGAGQWFIVPERDTVNATLVNGHELAKKECLKDGDEIAIGNPKTGNKRVAVRVRLVEIEA